MVWMFLSSPKVISFASCLHVADVKGRFLWSSPHQGTLHDNCHPNKNNTSYLMSVCSVRHCAMNLTDVVVFPLLNNKNTTSIWQMETETRDVTSSKPRLFVNGKKKGGYANLCCVCLRLWPLHHLPSYLQSLHIFRNYMPQNLMNLPCIWWGR